MAHYYPGARYDLAWLNRDRVPLLTFPYRNQAERRQREWRDEHRNPVLAGLDPLRMHFRFEDVWVLGARADHVRSEPQLLAVAQPDGDRVYLDLAAHCVVAPDDLDLWRARATMAMKLDLSPHYEDLLSAAGLDTLPPGTELCSRCARPVPMLTAHLDPSQHSAVLVIGDECCWPAMRQP